MVAGNASIFLSGFMENGSSFTLAGSVPIIASTPAESFPVGCSVACNSVVPAFYLGEGIFNVTVTSSWQTLLPMALESAFLNPFGGPIIWVSEDANSSIVLVSTYSAAAIDWQGVRSGGTISGTLGPTPVSGLFNLTSAAHEDLFAGTETETGTMTFYGVTPSGLDASGPYSGNSTIPTTGTIDCSALTGFPDTCTETGFSSAGSFDLDPVTVLVQGTYKLDWAVPALTFNGTAVGTATPSGGSITGVPQFAAGAILPIALALPLILLLKSRLRNGSIESDPQ
jgi:hypothetical protein